MTFQPDPQDLKQALRTATVMRTCPPLSQILEGKSKQAEEHIRRCVYCTDLLKDPPDTDAWDELAEAMHHLAFEPAWTEPKPGQIWSIKDSLAGWDDEYRYFNAPQVLILEVLQDHKAVHAAQIYDDLLLQGPGDIYLGSEYGFAQSWNTYTLSSLDLEAYWGETDQQTLDLVLKNEKADQEEIDEQSVLYFFRQQEFDTGAYFSLKSINKMMQDREDKALPDFDQVKPDWLDNRQMVVEKLKARHPEADLSPQAANSLEDLALLSINDHKLAMAASPEAELLTFNIVDLYDKDLQVNSALARLEHSSVLNNEAWISGSFLSEIDMDYLLAWFKFDEVNLRPADEINYKLQYFQVTFKNVDQHFLKKGKLILLGVKMNYV